MRARGIVVGAALAATITACGSSGGGSVATGSGFSPPGTNTTPSPAVSCTHPSQQAIDEGACPAPVTEPPHTDPDFTTAPTSAPPAPVVVPTTEEPAPAPIPVPTQAPALAPPPVETAAQSQAVSAAQNYLSLGSGFSQQGLIDQLVQGNQFAVADATSAVDSLNIDYNAQAVLSAKGYLALGSGFSHAGLVDQLEEGNNFTPAQAEAGVEGAGL